MTTEVKGFFDKLYFSESVLGEARLNRSQLCISVSGLFFLSGHPLESEGTGPFKGELIFDGVADSTRTLTEYIGDSHNPEGFKAPRQVKDKIPLEIHVNKDAVQEFAFEGYQESSSAWIDNWIVHAESFRLKLDSVPALPGAAA